MLVQEVGTMKKLAPAILEQAGGKVFTFGSYSLAVYGPGSDIDTLMCTPKHVTRDDFFQYFPDLIKRQTSSNDLTELTTVPDASVPIIKMELFDVSVDLIFTNIQLSAVPNSLLLSDNNLLRGLSEVDLKCVNGTRVTDRILTSVPQTKPFRLALRAVKLSTLDFLFVPIVAGTFCGRGGTLRLGGTLLSCTLVAVCTTAQLGDGLPNGITSNGHEDD